MSEALTPAEEADMEEYGVERRPVDYFHFGEYRYSSLKDAIAAAKRHRALA